MSHSVPLMLPIAYSCGPSQIVGAVMIPYNLLCATIHKVNQVWIAQNNSTENSQKDRESLQKKVDSCLTAAATHARCAVPVIGTLWEMSQQPPKRN